MCFKSSGKKLVELTAYTIEERIKGGETVLVVAIAIAVVMFVVFA
jgi:hypothetical protein